MTTNTQQITVTNKEAKALIQIIKDAGNGAKTAEAMKEDNFTWFNHTTIMAAGFSEPQAKGLMSSLEDKCLAQNYDDQEFGWCLSNKGIDIAYAEISKAQGQ